MASLPHRPDKVRFQLRWMSAEMGLAYLNRQADAGGRLTPHPDHLPGLKVGGHETLQVVASCQRPNGRDGSVGVSRGQAEPW